MITLLVVLSGAPATAETIVLQPGESYNSGDLNIMCVPGTTASGVVELTECQFWDDFKQRCLYEKKILSYGDARCVEECQHWDDFANECRFATVCTFHPGQRLFVRTVCDAFDSHTATCVRTRQEMIGNRRQRP